MSNYRRAFSKGGTFFFTVVSYRRQSILCDDILRYNLREGIRTVKETQPFKIEAWVLLPDHLHCIWTLPKGDTNYGLRWAMIKRFVTKSCSERYFNSELMTSSKIKRRESTIWQRRFWEHQIRDEEDFINHFDYIHYNPVKHKIVKNVRDWEYSTFHKYLERGIYSFNWGGPVVKINVSGE